MPTKNNELKINKNKNKNKNKKPKLLKGGNNVFSAIYEVFGSLINLGENMATEFESIKNLPAQINNASAPVAGQPNTP